MEKLLHYVWKHRILPLRALLTSDGQELEIVDAGLSNPNAGPDFFNAKVRIGQTMWAGNVEIHLRSSDWYRHGHDTDERYDNVILHVAHVIDCPVTTHSGKTLPQLQLDIPAGLAAKYEQLHKTENYPRCYPIIPNIETFRTHSWLDTLLCERLQERADKVLERLHAVNMDWEWALFMTLARNFGFGINGDAFEAWCRLIPLNRLGKHRDDLFQIEAIFLGLAGLLQADALPRNCREAGQNDPYFLKLQKEFAYQTRLFDLATPLPFVQWKYLRLRPQNFPHIRLAELAWMYHHGEVGLQNLIDAVMTEDEADNKGESTAIKALRKILSCETSDYWHDHIMFGSTVPHMELHLSRSSQNLIIINTVVPVLYAYATTHDRWKLRERLLDLLRELPAENNYILRQWQSCGLPVDNAADSQALIQLKREYCDRLDCLRCQFGYEYLKSEK